MERLFDLRFVIGAFFTIAGIMLLVYGFSEGASVNKWCGGIFVAFGLLMVALSYFKEVRDVNTEEAADRVLH
ncbi:MAG: hypothetical protein EOO15_16960 [Chitinophagaceae bacterium]|nr:MAG: hypothetical protein EOO15_16960 [Chitinophagaceae bacterium]